MTEIQAGVYVSRIDTDDWEPDLDVGGASHILFQEGHAIVGLWKAEADEDLEPAEVDIPARETIVVLEGDVRFGIAGQPILELGPGDMASLPKGRVVWDPSPACKVLWVYS